MPRTEIETHRIIYSCQTCGRGAVIDLTDEEYSARKRQGALPIPDGWMSAPVDDKREHNLLPSEGELLFFCDQTCLKCAVSTGTARVDGERGHA